MITVFLITTTLFASAEHIETIILIRHAEKSIGGLGQLSCQGFNRSLLLPSYFQKNFPVANAIFAPDPGDKVAETEYNYARYSYVRPLATIEPTAVALQLPVNTEIGYTNVTSLVSALVQKKYHHAVVYAVWEHQHIFLITKALLEKFHNQQIVPAWKNDDYSKVYVLTIHWNQHPVTIGFKITNEDLKNISTKCP